MSKINIKIVQNNETLNVRGLLNKNKLTYKDKNEHINITIGQNVIYLEKKNKESCLELIFDLNKITEGKYNTELGLVFLHIKTTNLEIKKNKIKIAYEVLESETKHTYEVVYEVI